MRGDDAGETDYLRSRVSSARRGRGRGIGHIVLQPDQLAVDFSPHTVLTVDGSSVVEVVFIVVTLLLFLFITSPFIASRCLVRSSSRTFVTGVDDCMA